MMTPKPLADVVGGFVPSPEPEVDIAVVSDQVSGHVTLDSVTRPAPADDIELFATGSNLIY